MNKRLCIYIKTDFKRFRCHFWHFFSKKKDAKASFFFEKKKDALASFQVLCQNLWLFLVEQRLEDIPRQERKKVHGHGITVENKLV